MIPGINDLGSAVAEHKVGDVYNPPGLTNFIGTVQVAVDPTGFSNLNFPPLGCGNENSAMLFVDDIFFGSTGLKTRIQWFPHKVVREVTYRNFSIRTTTVMGINENTLLERIDVANLSSSNSSSIKIGLGIKGNVGQNTNAWNQAEVFGSYNNTIESDFNLGAVVSSNPDACMIQGLFPKPDIITARQMSRTLELAPGERSALFLCVAVGSNRTGTINLYDKLVSEREVLPVLVEKEWDKEIESVFTPGNKRYSGNLPELSTSDDELMRLYITGILGVIYFKRDNPNSVYGRAYDTLMPAYWPAVTFLWDYSLSSLTHSLLDPSVMRRYLTDWMRTDIHQHFGTEYITGATVGPWYSVNDYAMSRMTNDYLRWTGDFEWLESSPDGKSGTKKVIDYLQDYASYWKKIESEKGLADYGGINNLLECVSTYVNQVASLNAGNVFSMRALADILEIMNIGGAESLRGDSDQLVKAIMTLYENGKGFWNVYNPSGDKVEVRHCYDFITILNTIDKDLDKEQKSEMIDFFMRELKTDTWMRALSPVDPDSSFSLRPDHQWNGAYPAWPAQAVTALYRTGRSREASAWLRGLAKSTEQGPFGQAHFTEDYIGLEAGGAPKASNEMPYICDWAVSSSGSWVNIIIESIFGVSADLDGTITATPDFTGFKSDAELHNLLFRGELYDVDAGGVRKAK